VANTYTFTMVISYHVAVKVKALISFSFSKLLYEQKIRSNRKTYCCYKKFRKYFIGQSTPFIKWVRITTENYTVPFNTTMNSTTTTSTSQTSGSDSRADSEMISLKLNKISYIKDGIKYTIKDLKFEQTASSTLKLKNLVLQDSGTYTCVMSTRSGTARRLTSLTVKPGKQCEDLTFLKFGSTSVHVFFL